MTAVMTLTGISVEEQENQSMRAPRNQIMSPVRLGQLPDAKTLAPLSAILANHSGELPAKDLWQRFGGEIDVFYAQLKIEVAHGWIEQPLVAELREISEEKEFA
jgi:type I restriction enzyme S subunit